MLAVRPDMYGLGMDRRGMGNAGQCWGRLNIAGHVRDTTELLAGRGNWITWIYGEARTLQNILL